MATFDALEGGLRSAYDRWRSGLRLQPLWAFLSVCFASWVVGLLLVAQFEPAEQVEWRWIPLILPPTLGVLVAFRRWRRNQGLLSTRFQEFYREFADLNRLEALKNGLDLWLEHSKGADGDSFGATTSAVGTTGTRVTASADQTAPFHNPLAMEAIRRNLQKVDLDETLRLLDVWLKHRGRKEGTQALRTAALSLSVAWVITTIWQMDAASTLYLPWTASPATLKATNTAVETSPLAAIRFTALTLSATPPAYTGLPSSTITYPESELVVPNGSRITLEGTLSEEVQTAQWVRKTSSAGGIADTLNLEPQADDSTLITTAFTLRERTPLATRTDTLKFILKDSLGRENPNRFRLIVQASPDLAPSASILSPPQQLESDQVDELPLLFTVRDDHGISQVELRYALKRAFVTDSLFGSLSMPAPPRNEITPYSWNLSELRLRPRDELIYWIRVRDTDPITGPKWGESLRHSLKVPSLADIADLFEDETEQVESQLESLAEEQEAFAQELEEAMRELQEGNQNTPQNRMRLNQLQQQREQVEQAVSEAREAMESLEQQMSQSDLLSEETRRAYKELQDLMQSLDSPELKRALQELQQALSQMNANQIQQAMEKLDFNEELYRKRLERTLDLFKTLNVQMQIEQMVKRYEEAAELAEKAMEAMEDGDSAASESGNDASGASDSTNENESGAGEQSGSDSNESNSDAQQTSNTQQPSLNPEASKMLEELASELSQIQELTQKLTENPPARRKEAIENFQAALGQQQAVTQEELAELMEMLEKLKKAREEFEKQAGARNQASSPSQNNSSPSKQAKSDQSQSGQSQSSQSQPQSLSKDLLSQMRQAMEFMQSLNQQQARVNLQAMQRVLAGLIQLSIDQEVLARETETLPTQNPLYTELAQRQRTITTQFSTLSDTLIAIAKEIPGLPDALLQRQISLQRTLEESVRQMAERSQPQARPISRQAMALINELALLTSDVISQLQQQQNGQGGDGEGSSSQSSGGQGQGQMSLQQMIENLQQMRGDQARLNQEMQGFVNDLQGDRLQNGQQGRQQALDQFAKRQQALRRQLQELRQRGALPSGDRLQSEMERILEQMDRAIEDLRGGRTDDLLRQRQQNILSRMLTTESSLQTRGQEEERKGREASRTEIANTGLTTEELLELLRQQLDNPRYGQFTPEIKQQIEEYFSRVVGRGE